ncbi:hypothetical protein K1T71_010331 [Dendrolimus kikuchii]|uniref:Uncharacterized protein n=1 Tax=Dendrolimus kikuchii TaxID=765133 RepID=A0ACC1CRY1_9NEOP|nr:hypothetical protein K1T71_010331 [Dendrolimus kikuchii]
MAISENERTEALQDRQIVNSEERKKRRTDGCSVRVHCCRASAGSRSAAAARWRGGQPPAGRIRDAPQSGALSAHYHPAINKSRATTEEPSARLTPQEEERNGENYSRSTKLPKYTKNKATSLSSQTGKILLDKVNIVKRWKRYIESLYNGNGLNDEDIETEQSVEKDNLGPPILRTQFNRALHQIQMGKAPGEDVRTPGHSRACQNDPIFSRDETKSQIRAQYRVDYLQSLFKLRPLRPEYFEPSTLLLIGNWER